MQAKCKVVIYKQMLRYVRGLLLQVHTFTEATVHLKGSFAYKNVISIFMETLVIFNNVNIVTHH